MSSRLKRYRLLTIASGSNAGLWVSIGFSSLLKRNDVLHVVAGEQPRPGGAQSRARLYVERFDQIYSCDGGAECVRVRPQSIEVHLTPKAAHLLSFESNVLLFECERRPSGYAKAMDTLREIARVNRRVKVEEVARVASATKGPGKRTRTSERSKNRPRAS